MKKILLIFGLLVFTMAIYAQDEPTPKAKITQVMQSEEDYLYADQTCATVEQALERAQNILMQEVEAYLKESGNDGEVVKGTVTEQMVTITVQRGDKYRVFVYVNKSDIDAKTSQPSTEVTVEPKPTEPIIVSATKTKTDSVQATEIVVKQNDDNGILGNIVVMTSRLQIYDYIQLLNKEGENISFVEHPSVDEQARMYLILYRRGGQVEAVLTPSDAQGIRHNLATGEPDTKENHPATSVNGFIYEQ